MRRAPEVGPFHHGFFRSPLRGPWLASFVGSALLPLIAICAATGFLSHAAYEPDLGRNRLFDPGVELFAFGWPTSPSWLYAATQGLHVITGVAAIPLLLLKLWAVIPKLYENPPLRSLAHALERASLAVLVGGSLFVFGTGVMNIQLFYPWGFSFVPAHYLAAVAFLAALAFHVAVKLPLMTRTLRERGVVRPLRDPAPEPQQEGTTAPSDPAPPTMTRRTLVVTAGAGSVGLALMTTGQVVGGPLRELALLAPRGRTGDDFPVNKTFAAVKIDREQVGEGWRLLLRVGGERRAALSREELLQLDQTTARLPIACVEGWSTTQEWTGVRISELARIAGIGDPDTVLVGSLQPRGAFRQATLSARQIADPRSLLALRVNGRDLSLDHGFPARVIVPALPGVHCTKWVRGMDFT